MRRYTEEDKAKVVNMVQDGLTSREIADDTGFSHTSVKRIVKKYIDESGFVRPFKEGNAEWNALNDRKDSKSYIKRAAAVHKIKTTKLEDSMFKCPEACIDNEEE